MIRSKLVDIKAPAGDSSDNISRVGHRRKDANQPTAQFGSVEGVYKTRGPSGQNQGEFGKPIWNRLFSSRKLAEIDTAALLPLQWLASPSKVRDISNSCTSSSKSWNLNSPLQRLELAEIFSCPAGMVTRPSSTALLSPFGTGGVVLDGAVAAGMEEESVLSTATGPPLPEKLFAAGPGPGPVGCTMITDDAKAVFRLAPTPKTGNKAGAQLPAGQYLLRPGSSMEMACLVRA